MHKIRDRDIEGRCGNKASVLERVDQRTLRWFGHMERLDKGRLAKGFVGEIWMILGEGVGR